MLKTKITVLLCILVIFPIQGRAEGRVGIKVGFSISNCYYTAVSSNPHTDLEIDLSPYLGYDIKWVQLAPQKALFSPYFGVYYDIKLTDKFSLKPELSFVQKGLSFNQSKYERIVYMVVIDYLEIPVSLGYKLFQGRRASTEIYFGGYGAFKIDAAKKVAYHDSHIEKIPLSTVNSFDWGAQLGVVYKRRIFKKTLLFDFRLFLGFSDIFSPPGTESKQYFGTQKTKITGAYITLGYEL